MMRDLASDIKCSRGMSPVAATSDNTPYVSQIIDTAGFLSATFVGIFGAIADLDATFTVLVEDGNVANLSDAAAVPDEYLIGIEAMGLKFDSDDKAWKIGYCGPKRYARVTVTPVNNSGAVTLAGVWVQGHPRTAPRTPQVV